jgi:hypothetical protein
MHKEVLDLSISVPIEKVPESWQRIVQRVGNSALAADIAADRVKKALSQFLPLKPSLPFMRNINI